MCVYIYIVCVTYLIIFVDLVLSDMPCHLIPFKQLLHSLSGKVVLLTALLLIIQ